MTRTLALIRALRAELQAEAGGTHIWPHLVDKFPADSDIQIALALAYELGYEDGESSVEADRTTDEED